VLNHVKRVSIGPWLSTADNVTVLEKTMNVNFMAYVRLASNALQLLQKSNGSIVVVSSLMGDEIFVQSFVSCRFLP